MAEVKPGRDHTLVICTLRYSSNLGDGVIGDCLEHLVRRVQPNRNVRHLDMAGRLDFPSPTNEADQGPDLAKTLFYRCPPALRPMLTRLAWPLLFRPKIKAAWDQVRPDGPFELVFGGGQMLSDLALNFPLKFSFVVQLAANDRAPMAVSAVGVSKQWSKAGQALFQTALTSPLMTGWSVRDAQSLDNLQAHVKALTGRVAVTVDPGIWAAEVYGLTPPAANAAALRVGLGVSEPAELAAYSTAADTFTEGRMLAYWSELAHRIASAGHRPVFFTNGSEDDEAFLNRLADRLASDEVTFDRLPRATRPAQLADHFKLFDVLVSHRLHANIIAFSAGLPSVALVWDDKVRAFTTLAGRDRWTLKAGASAGDTFDLVVSAAQEGVDDTRRDELKAQALSDVVTMLDQLKGLGR